MIKAQGGDAGDNWLRYNVRTVVRASDADFENGGINLPGKSTNAQGGNKMRTYVQR